LGINIIKKKRKRKLKQKKKLFELGQSFVWSKT